jgi:hypothetical protein
VLPRETGIFFHQQTAAALIAAVQSFDAAHFDPQRIRRHAEQYDISVFTRRMAEFVDAALSELQGPQGARPWRPESRGADKALAEEALLHSRGETSALSLHT